MGRLHADSSYRTTPKGDLDKYDLARQLIDRAERDSVKLEFSFRRVIKECEPLNGCKTWDTTGASLTTITIDRLELGRDVG